MTLPCPSYLTPAGPFLFALLDLNTKDEAQVHTRGKRESVQRTTCSLHGGKWGVGGVYQKGGAKGNQNLSTTSITHLLWAMRFTFSPSPPIIGNAFALVTNPRLCQASPFCPRPAYTHPHSKRVAPSQCLFLLSACTRMGCGPCSHNASHPSPLPPFLSPPSHMHRHSHLRTPKASTATTSTRARKPNSTSLQQPQHAFLLSLPAIPALPARLPPSAVWHRHRCFHDDPGTHTFALSALLYQTHSLNSTLSPSSPVQPVPTAAPTSSYASTQPPPFLPSPPSSRLIDAAAASAGSNFLREMGGMASAAAAAPGDMHSSFPSEAPPTGVLSNLVRLLQEESIVDVAYSYGEQVR